MNLLQKIVGGKTEDNNQQKSEKTLDNEVVEVDEEKDIIDKLRENVQKEPKLQRQLSELDDILKTRNEVKNLLKTMEDKRSNFYYNIFQDITDKVEDINKDEFTIQKELSVLEQTDLEIEMNDEFKTLKNLVKYYSSYQSHPVFGKLFPVETLNNSENDFPGYYYTCSGIYHFQNNEDPGKLISPMIAYFLKFKKDIIKNEKKRQLELQENEEKLKKQEEEKRQQEKEKKIEEIKQETLELEKKLEGMPETTENKVDTTQEKEETTENKEETTENKEETTENKVDTTQDKEETIENSLE